MQLPCAIQLVYVHLLQELPPDAAELRVQGQEPGCCTLHTMAAKS